MGLFCVIFVPPYLGSTLQLEAFRLRGGFDVNARAFGSASVHAVFADIRERVTSRLAAELKESGLSDDVGAEVEHVLQRLLTAVEQAFGRSAAGRTMAPVDICRVG